MTTRNLTISKAEAMNPSRRSTMEDVHVTHFPGEWGCNDDEMSFIGVYDGHGGRDTADFLEGKLHQCLAEELNMEDEGDSDNHEHDNKASIEMKLERSFLMTDAECRMSGIQTSGATVVLCLIKRHSNGRKITIHSANAGDARAVLSCQPTFSSNLPLSQESKSYYSSKAGGYNQHHHNIYNSPRSKRLKRLQQQKQKQNILIPNAYRLSFDHKSDDETEMKRIRDAGGFLLKNRVLGIMAVARSLGDHGMKNYVIGRPFVNTVEIDLDCVNIALYDEIDDDDGDGNKNDGVTDDTGKVAGVSTTNSTSTISTHPSSDTLHSEFVIVACDGIWDVISDQEAVDMVKKYVKLGGSSEAGMKKYKETAAKMLCHKALNGGSTDNITVLVVWF